MCESPASKPTDEINCSSCGDTNVKYKEHVPEEDKTYYWCKECALALRDTPDEVFEEVARASRVKWKEKILR